jgi:hypothetical protein
VLGKSVAIGRPSGFVKWFADTKTEQLLGARVVRVYATELIADATTATRGSRRSQRPVLLASSARHTKPRQLRARRGLRDEIRLAYRSFGKLRADFSRE